MVYSSYRPAKPQPELDEVAGADGAIVVEVERCGRTTAKGQAEKSVGCVRALRNTPGRPEVVNNIRDLESASWASVEASARRGLGSRSNAETTSGLRTDARLY